MAFSKVPTDVIASWSEDGTDVTFPIASVAELDAAEADGLTGDSRRILFALVEQWYRWFIGMSSEDKPEKLSITKSSTLQTDGTFRNQYTLTFYCEVTGQEVLDEV